MMEAQAHLGAALSQSIAEDDPIIMGHVRDAKATLCAALYERCSICRDNHGSEVRHACE
jgi:hypothetical protein